MNKYEIMFIVKSDMEEAEIKKTAEAMKKVLTDNKAKFLETKEMGKKYVSGKHTNNGTTLLISNGFHKESNDQHRFMTYDEINIIKLKK